MAYNVKSAVRRLPPLPTLRDILRMYGIRAKKSLSQNFIMDPRILNKFARTAGDLAGKYVVEVGPGPGGITRAILDAGAQQVHVVEKDSRFLPSLQLLQEATGPEKLNITIGDCLHYDPKGIFPMEVSREWDSHESPDVVLMGNLPFNVATPLFLRLMQAMNSRSNIYSYGRVSALLTFQHEVAHRMIVPPGDPERCRLSVTAQNWAEVEYMFNLPGGAFVPPPEVGVGIVKLTPLREPYIKGLPFAFINKVVTAIFSGKQKCLKNSISGALFPSQISKRMTQRLLDMASVGGNEIAINLPMEDIGNICHAYKHICDEEEIKRGGKAYLEQYVSANLKNAMIDDEEKRLSNNQECYAAGTSTKFDIHL